MLAGPSSPSPSRKTVPEQMVSLRTLCGAVTTIRDVEDGWVSPV